MSVTTDGGEAHGPSYDPAISSANGKAVAFRSMAPDLVDGDTNTCTGYPTPGTCPDIFVRDRDTDNDQVFDEPDAVTTTRVSVSSTGTQGNNASWSPAIGPGGFRVAFDSLASNLVDGDTNGASDVFVNDFMTETTRVSVDSDGTEGNGGSSNPAISWDGSYIAFDSWASNLVWGDNNTKRDIFLRDRSDFPPGGTNPYNVRFKALHIWLDGQDQGDFLGTGTATVVRGEPYWNESGKECADYHIESLTLTGKVNNVPVEIDVGEGLTVPVSSGTICEGAAGFDVTLSLYVEETDGGGSQLSSSPILAQEGNHLCNCCTDCGLQTERWSSIDCTAVTSEVPADQVIYDCGTEYSLCDCSTDNPRVRVDTPDTGALLLGAVGGIAEWPGGTTGSDQLGRSSSGWGFNYTALGGALAAVAIVVLAAGAWLARRRWAR